MHVVRWIRSGIINPIRYDMGRKDGEKMSKKDNVNIEIPEPITGEDVFKWRRERGFTRGKLGDLLCGTSWECVKSWENFRHEPPKLLRLALDHLALSHPVKFTLDENGTKTKI